MGIAILVGIRVGVEIGIGMAVATELATVIVIAMMKSYSNGNSNILGLSMIMSSPRTQKQKYCVTHVVTTIR